MFSKSRMSCQLKAKTVCSAPSKEWELKLTPMRFSFRQTNICRQRHFDSTVFGSNQTPHSTADVLSPSRSRRRFCCNRRSSRPQDSLPYRVGIGEPCQIRQTRAGIGGEGGVGWTRAKVQGGV